MFSVGGSQALPWGHLDVLTALAALVSKSQPRLPAMHGGPRPGSPKAVPLEGTASQAPRASPLH